MVPGMTAKKQNPPIPRPASTVILVRSGNNGMQVYLMKRSVHGGAFGGNYVFPGGTLTPQDRDSNLWLGHLDLDLEAISRRFHGDLPPEMVISFGVAAIRETFEEAGVLLAKGKDSTMDRLCRYRLKERLPEKWFQEQLVSDGWTLAFSKLFPWSHWVTPTLMPKRFDARFFVAFMPEGQVCVPDARETTYGVWMSPREALQKNFEGEIPLSAPTLVTLHELLRYDSPEQLQGRSVSHSWGATRSPRLVPSKQGAFILQPWDPLCDENKPVDPEDFSTRILPPAEPFSRLWMREGIWRPVES